MVTQTRAKTLTLSHLISKFIERHSLSAKTRQYYTDILSKVEWYARKEGWPEPHEITRAHIQDFLSYVANESYRWPEADRTSFKPASTATIHHYGQVVKSLFNWAEEEGFLLNNPSRFIKLGSPGYKDVEPYSDEEVLAMLEVCEQDARFGYRYLGIRNKAIISLFVATGLRVEELSNINLDHLDPKLSEIWVLGKGAKPRLVPLSGEARKSLSQYLRLRPDGGKSLWQTSDGTPMAKDSVEIMITRLKRRAGVTSGGGAHRFRHYFATRYLEAGGDLNLLRLLLGHSTLNMVLKYSKFVDIRKALARHEQFDPLDQLLREGNHNRGGNSWGQRYQK